jgi:hypothetical protein
MIFEDRLVDNLIISSSDCYAYLNYAESASYVVTMLSVVLLSCYVDGSVIFMP